MRDLFLSSGTGHSLMVLAFVIGLGLLLGKLKYKGISLGSIWILLTGLLCGALGIKADTLFLHFLKEFGLVIFVFAVGLQVGPGFFHSFKGNGLKLNFLSILLIFLSLGCTLVLYGISSEQLPALTGVMSGALTNTPGLGTAQQTYYDIAYGTFLAEVDKPAVSSSIAGAFAVAYPVGILSLVLLLLCLRRVFKTDLNAESDREDNGEMVREMTVQVENPAVFGKTLTEAIEKFNGHFVPSALTRDGQTLNPATNPVLQQGDRIILETQKKDKNMVRILFGQEVENRSGSTPVATGNLVNRNLTVTKSSMTGRKLSDLDILGKYGVTVTLVNRSGIRLVAQPDLFLQMGDSLKVIGEEKAIAKVADLVGNSSEGLDKPNLIPVFIGIGLGLILGYLPIRFPGMSNVFRLGLAGGPLIIAILLGHFGPKRKITTYTTTSANRMLREVGLSLMLGTIGLSAGSIFTQGFHAIWILFAALIVLVPALVTALVARYACKMSFLQICGLLTGATTNAPVLEFVKENYGSDRATVSYATVYPFALFLQVMVAQILIILSFVL